MARAGRTCRWCSIASATSASAPAWPRSWRAPFPGEPFRGARCMRSSITSPIWRRRFSCRRSTRRSWCRWTASAISRAPPGASAAAPRSRSRTRLFPAFARHLLPGADPVSRLSALRRRIQGDGARALRRAAPGERCARSCGCEADGAFELGPGLLPPPPGEDRLRVGQRRADRSAPCSRPALEELLGPPRASRGRPLDRSGTSDIARSVQAMYEEAFFHLLNRLHERYQLDALALAGGCAMNSVANGKVYRASPFKRLYVQSAAGDAGGAIGAAFRSLASVGAAEKRPRMIHASGDHAYWGPDFRTREIGALLGAQAHEINAAGCTGRGCRTKPRFAGARHRRSPTARWSAGSRAAWSGGRARSATARSSATRAAPT